MMIKKDSNQPFKWVSIKELVFIFGACSVVAVLLHTQDQLELRAIWNDTLPVSHYKDIDELTRNQDKLPLPIVTDLNSDGRSDVVMVTPDGTLRIHTAELSPLYLGQHGFKHSTKSVSLLTTARVVAMATGFLQPYQSMVQIRKQVIVVLYSDWTVTCFSHNLKELWSKRATEKDNMIIIGEATVLISSVRIKSTSKTDGTIFVAGRVKDTDQDNYQSSYQRIRRGKVEEHDQYKLSLGHYSSYALNGSTGNVLWRHEPGDYEIQPAYSDSVSSFSHYKLVLHKYMNHQGEVSWHQYSTAIVDVMPHIWHDNSDSKMDLGHFKKDRKKTKGPAVTEHISKFSDLAVDHIVGYAFGGLRPHSQTEHIKNPNVLVIHTMKGIEILHVHTGRPLFTLPLSPTHSIHGDINSDGIIEHVHAVVNPGNNHKPGDVINKHDDIECYGQATPLYSPNTIFKHSICRPTHWTESFIATEKWIPKLNTYKRKKVNHAITEPHTPLLIESPSHQHPLKLSSVKRNSSSGFNMGVVYDTIFLLSSGRVTSIGPAGQFNWQVDTISDWDIVTDILYNEHNDHQLKLHSELFTPTLAGFSLKPYSKKTHILIIGWNTVSILNSLDGTILVEYPLPHPPISKAVIADFNDDGTNDVIIVTNNRVIGLSLVHRSGFMHTTVLSLFVGLVIVIVAVYTRQRTGFLIPKRKQATD